MNFLLQKLISNNETKYLALVSAAIFFITLLFLLIFPDPIGMADTGDYLRTTYNLGLEHLQKNAKVFSSEFWEIYYSNLGNYRFPRTMTQAIASVALFINNLFNTSGLFNILYLGLVYIILYTLAFYIFVSNALNHLRIPLFLKILLVLLFIFLLSDGMFTFYFNSFFQEGTSAIFILLFIAFSLKKNVSPVIILSVLMLLSIVKIQNIIFLLMFPVIIYLYCFKITKRVIGIYFILFLIIIIGSSVSSKRMQKPNIYNSFFYGILKNTDLNTSMDIIKSAGLDVENYKGLANTNYASANNNLGRMHSDSKESYDFYEKVNHTEIILLYLKYPSVLINNIYMGLNELKKTPAKPSYIGNLTKSKSDNSPEKAVVNTFLGSYLNYIYIYIYILSILVSLFILQKDKYSITNLEKTILLLTFIIPFIFGANMLGDGFYEFVKHSFNFYFLIVFLLICNILFFIESFIITDKLSSISQE